MSETGSLIQSAIQSVASGDTGGTGEGDVETVESGSGNDEGGDVETTDDEGESFDSGSDAGDEDGEQDAEAEVVAPPVVEVDEFAKEHEIDLKKEGNRIPYKRLKVITGNAEKKLAKLLTGQDVPEGKTAREIVTAYRASVDEKDARITRHEATIAERDSIGNVMADEPERFLRALPLINPKYAELIGHGQAAQAAVPVDDPQPEFDYDLGNGKKTYTQEGLAKYHAWLERGLKTRIMSDLSNEIKPIKDLMKEKQDREVKIAQIDRMIDNARAEWKGFQDWEPAILAQLQSSRKPNYSLLNAYHDVMEQKHQESLAKAKTDYDAMHKKVTEDMRKLPTSTSSKAAGATGSKPVEGSGKREPQSTASVIRAAIKGRKVT